MPPKLAAVVGVRPQYIKAAALKWELARSSSSWTTRLQVVDVRQHYDRRLRESILRDIGLSPEVVLPIERNRMDGRDFFRRLTSLVDAIATMRPVGVLVFGDADPALMGALVAAKLGIPLAHIEAGARRDPCEQEDFNSRAVDARAAVKLCVTQRAIRHLEAEGLGDGTVLTGDLAWRWYRAMSAAAVTELEDSRDALVSIHRPQNLTAERFRTIVSALRASRTTATWVTHPRYTEELAIILREAPGIVTVPPQGFRSMMRLVAVTSIVVSDSGGLMREAHLIHKPIVIVRPIGGWPELEEGGFAVRAGGTVESAITALQTVKRNPLPQASSPLVVAGGIETGVHSLEEWADGCC